MRRLISLFLVVLLAAACGQKGPLYLRDNPPPGVKPPKPEAYKPQPYPKDPAKEPAEGDDAGAAKK
jgi:predicted small lipoprotein YifL